MTTQERQYCSIHPSHTSSLIQRCYTVRLWAFLVPYFLMLLFGAVPLFFMELVLGQFHRRGAIAVWKITPLFQGTHQWLITFIRYTFARHFAEKTRVAPSYYREFSYLRMPIFFTKNKVIIIIIIKNEKIRVTLCENAAGALYIVNKMCVDGLRNVEGWNKIMSIDN